MFELFDEVKYVGHRYDSSQTEGTPVYIVRFYLNYADYAEFALYGESLRKTDG